MSKLDSWLCFGCVILLFVAWCLCRMASITEDEMDFEESQQIVTEEVRWWADNRPEWCKRLDLGMWDQEYEAWLEERPGTTTDVTWDTEPNA